MNRERQPSTGIRSVPLLGPLLELFNSVWLGIGLMVCIFVYASIASAGILYPTSWNIFESDHWERYLVRASFDKTEMEVFACWPFNLLIALLCVNLIVVTIRRIRFNVINLGVWMIHTGIIILCVASVYYFGTKIEGDTPVFRRRAVITIPTLNQSGTLLIRPGSELVLGQGDQCYRFEVSDILPEWPLLSGEDKGKKAYTAQISVQTPTQQFVRQVHAGYPQYTEDVIPGQGRAVKVTGKPLVDENLDIRLEYEPQEYVYLMQSAALYSRFDGAADWRQRPLRDLPHYHERVASRNDVWWPDAELDPIELFSNPVESDDPLAGFDVRITGFLPYAHMTAQWKDGGDHLNPVMGVRLASVSGGHQDYELAAFDRELSSAGDGRLHFRWLESESQIEKLTEFRENRLLIKVPGTDASLDVTLPPVISRDPEPTFVDIPGTDFAYRVSNVFRELPAMAESMKGKVFDVAIVEIRRGDQVITRMVADPPEATRDMSASHEPMPPDPAIEMTFLPGVSPLPGVTLAVGPGPIGIHVLFPTAEAPEHRHQKAEPRKPVQLTSEITLTVMELLEQAEQDIRPEVVPPEQQQADADGQLSMVKVEISKGNWSWSRWLPQNHYALPNEQYAVPSRISYSTQHVHLPDGQAVEIMYSRERMLLPAAVVLDDFELLTHTGGFSGSALTVRDFVSKVRFAIPGMGDGWTPPSKVASNHPADFAGFWFFQASWDPPLRDRNGTIVSQGMNYTGLGVGNRNGVHAQLAGTAIAVVGMIYAFYVKPILIRRRRESARSNEAMRAEAVEPVQREEPALVG